MFNQYRFNVKIISKQLKDCYQQGKKVRIYHGSTNSTRTQNFQKGNIIDISKLNQVLKVNQQEQTALVEPNVPMDALVKETLKFNLLPPVVMEFPGISVGGGIQGGAGESSSFKWGGFHNIFLEYEVVLGDGTVIQTTPKKQPDLFYGIPCTYGSLGVITAAKLKLIPAKKFVKLTYHKIQNSFQALSLMQHMVNKKIDFIDGILFSQNLGVIMTGTFAEQGILPVATFRKATDDWFYLHSEKIVRKHAQYEELIPLEDYLFRYNRGGFWVGYYPFKKLRIPFNRVSRFLLNPLFQTRTLYRFLQAINISQHFLIQDLALPKNKVLPFLKFLDKTVRIYPLWLCPLKPNTKEKFSPVYLNTDLAIDVGVWGKIKNDYNFSLKINRQVENITKKLGGRKILYAHAYYPEDEFWQIYDKKWYQFLRKKYKAKKVFPDMYEKTKVVEKYQPSIIKGLLEVISSPFKLKVSQI